MHKRTLSQAFKTATWQHYLKSVPAVKRDKVSQRERAIREYLEDDKTFAIDIAKKHQVSPETLRTWVKEYTAWNH